MSDQQTLSDSYANLRLVSIRPFLYVDGDPSDYGLCSAAIAAGLDQRLFESFEDGEWVRDPTYVVARYAIKHYRSKRYPIPSAHLIVELSKRAKSTDESMGIARAVGEVEATPYPSQPNVLHAVSTLIDCRMWHEFQSSVRRGGQDVRSGLASPGDVVARVSSELHKLVSWAKGGRVGLDTSTFHSMVEEGPERISKCGSRGLETGLALLDSETSGLLPGDLVLIWGCTNVGKSWLLHYICRTAYRNGHLAVLASAEMSVARNLDRLASAFLGVDSRVFRSPDLNRWERDLYRIRLKKCLRLAGTGDILILGPAVACTTVGIREAVLEISQLRKPALIGVDYLGRVKPSVGYGHGLEWSVIGEAASELKSIGEEFGVPVVVVAQISKEALTRGPSLMNGAFSFVPAMHADLIIELRHASEEMERQAVLGERLQRVRELRYTIVKGRDSSVGYSGVIEMDFATGKVMNFAEDQYDDISAEGF